MTTPASEERAPLRKAPDREVHPVTPTAEELAEARSLQQAAVTEAAPRKDKRVTLMVRVPKSLRKALRAEAKRRSMSVDELVTILLGDRLSR